MKRMIAIALFGLALGLGPFHAAEARPLVVGSVHSDPSEEMKEWLPFTRDLAGRLAGDGISQGSIVIARDVPEMIGFLKAGKVDLYIDSPIVMLDVMNATGSKMLVRRWKNRSAEYTSVIFVRKDSGIVLLSDLKDKVIAFQKESSSTGYLLPRLEFQLAGLTVHPMGGGVDKPPAGQVGYRWSGADRNTVAWVFHGRVAAGATSGEDWDKVSAEQRAQMAIIFESPRIPRHVVVHRADLPPALVARIKDELLAFDKTDQGRKILATFEKTTKFDEIPQRSLEALKRYQDSLRAQRVIP